jgi:hypothetical protein
MSGKRSDSKKISSVREFGSLDIIERMSYQESLRKRRVSKEIPKEMEKVRQWAMRFDYIGRLSKKIASRA